MNRPLLISAMIAFTLCAFMNCSGVKFTHDDGASTVQGDPSDGKDPGNTTGGNGGNNGGNGGDATGSVNQPGSPGTNGNNVDGGIQIGAGPGGSDISNAGGPPGTVTGNGNTVASILPKLQFIGPECVRLTNCAIIFRLDKAYAGQTEFNWRTDDSRYGTPPDPGKPMWGKAGYHYVSTTGHVVFPAGTIEQTVHVRNINPDNVEISIPILMSQCSYNGLYESCLKFFAQ